MDASNLCEPFPSGRNIGYSFSIKNYAAANMSVKYKKISKHTILYVYTHAHKRACIFIR